MTKTKQDKSVLYIPIFLFLLYLYYITVMLPVDLSLCHMTQGKM